MSNTVLLPNGKCADIAEYQEQLLPDYNGNPLIEALPDILSKEDFTRSVISYPLFSANERDYAPHLRSHCVMRLMNYFQPTSKHIDLEQRISRILRQGYLARNPLLPEYKTRLREINKTFREDLRAERDGLHNCISGENSPCSGFTIIGVSGVGKSTALKRILQLYPQVVLHSDYKGTHLSLYQIVYLKLDCPHAGSLKGLCGDFFKAVDNLVGTNYYSKYGSTRNSEDLMLAQMAQIAATHWLGLLVIDEIQNLSEAKSGGKERMLNFFVKLDNTIGVPVIRVGTNKAIKVLQGDFRQARRGAGAGDFYWERFKIDSFQIDKDDDTNAENKKELQIWNFFVEQLFDYQWTQEEVEFSTEFSELLYDESQGVIDIAIKLYMITQWRAMTTKVEKITPALMRQVALDSFKLVRPMLDALRSGIPQRIATYSDITPIDIDEFYEHYKAKLELGEQKEFERQQKKLKQQAVEMPHLDSIVSGLMELRVPHKLALLCAEKVYVEQQSNDTVEDLIRKGFAIASTSGFDVFENPKLAAFPKPARPLKKYVGGDLRVIVAEAEKSNVSAYEGLKNNGVIKSPLKEFAIA